MRKDATSSRAASSASTTSASLTAAPLPTGGFINQADGTAWMAMYTLNLMRIALELATEDPVYEDIAWEFFEHFLYIAGAMTNIGDEGIALWDDCDEFYYDVLNLPGGQREPLGAFNGRTDSALRRGSAGSIPSSAFPPSPRGRSGCCATGPTWRGSSHAGPSPAKATGPAVAAAAPSYEGVARRMLDEAEFLSRHGIRSVSKAHAAAPFEINDGRNALHRGDKSPASPPRGFRRQLELAWAGLDAAQFSDRGGAL